MVTSSSEEILRLTFPFKTKDVDLVQRIKSSNLLLVGAGGIGCEVLKGLLLTGFPRITIIDLDTIDVSNLNRQFLYNKTHVGQSKAEVAAKVSVERFSHRDGHGPDARLVSEVKPIHDSILNLKYDRQFYQQFTMVINALDNNATRIHVNRLCLAAGVPLVESGSAGYFGNVSLIKGGVTSCFECEAPKKDENSYASCTIRNTPSQPIHCIVWAKHLFAQIFGQSDEDISPNVTVMPSTKQSNQSSSTINEKLTTRRYVELTGYNPQALFNKIFYYDVLYLKEMKNLWENRIRSEPQELLYDKIKSGELMFNDINHDSSANNKYQNGASTSTLPSSSSSSSSKIMSDQRLWTMQECLEVFVDSLAKLKQRLKSEQCLEWDKDDDTAVDFIASVANFRCHCFNIARKSKFEVKSLAGNIIPAISSTNTIVGGYVLLQTVQLLQSLLPERIFKTDQQPSEEQVQQEADLLLKNGFRVYINNINKQNFNKTVTEPLLMPKTDCIACSSQVKEITVELPFSKLTLADLIEQIVIKKFKTIAPDINCYDLRKMIYAADDEDELKQADSFYRQNTLDSLDYFVDNICLNVKDLEQDFEVNLRLKNVEFSMEEQEALGGDMFRILMDEDELDTIKKEQEKLAKKNIENNGESLKRKEPEEDKKQMVNKKQKITATIDLDVGEEILCLFDDED